MRLTGQLILVGVLLCLCACATPPQRSYRNDALAALGRARSSGAESIFPQEMLSAQQAFDQGEVLTQEEEYQEAERYFYLTLQKGALLDKEARSEIQRRKDQERRIEEEKKAELERLAKEEADRQARAKAQAEAKAEAEALARKEAAEAELRKKVRQPKLVARYTVRRGESLPLIASQPEVYNDRNLWPLLYRANRDQISDPRHIWPGQVLRIPRNLGRDDIYEARRYAQERPLH